MAISWCKRNFNTCLVELLCSSKTLKLQMFAIEFLNHLIVALTCERSWSRFEFIHKKKQNRLTIHKTTNLVFVFSSLQLKYKISNLRYNDKFVEWMNDDKDSTSSYKHILL
jgi:hypothetical protein